MLYACKKFLSIIFLSIFCLGVAPSISLAAISFSVSPLLIEQKTEGRDIFTKDITLSNHTNNKTRVYASVHEIKVGDNTQILDFVDASVSDRRAAVTSWIQISMARLELPPNGDLVVPLKVRVHPDALPGVYHAYIGFASGHNRDVTDAMILAGKGNGVILKIVIDQDIREQLQLVNFITDRFTLSPDNNNFSFTLENTGDVPLTPTGEVIIYDTRGRELSSVVVNSTSNSIKPGERAKFTEKLPYTDEFGKNKAYLTINYGLNGQAAVFDTAYYYSMPWYYLAGIFLFLLLTMFSILFVLKRAFASHDNGGLEHGIYEVPLFVKESKEHTVYDHDINLKIEKLDN